MTHWICGNCGFANEGTAAHCSHCDLPAEVALRAAEKKPSVSPAESMAWVNSSVAANAWLFFPEVIPAAAIVVGSPLWLADLLINGHFLGAALFVVGIFSCVYGFVHAARGESKWGAYASIVGTLVVALFAFSVNT